MTILTEQAVIELMKTEHAKLRVEAEQLWQRLQIAQEEMYPYKVAYEAAHLEWGKAKNLADALARCIEAKGGQ